MSTVKRSLISNETFSRSLTFPNSIVSNSIAFNPFDRSNLSSQDSNITINNITNNVNNVNNVITNTIIDIVNSLVGTVLPSPGTNQVLITLNNAYTLIPQCTFSGMDNKVLPTDLPLSADEGILIRNTLSTGNCLKTLMPGVPSTILTTDSNGKITWSPGGTIPTVNIPTSDGLTSNGIPGGFITGTETIGLDGWEITSNILRPKANYLTSNRGSIGDSSHVVFQEHLNQLVLYNASSFVQIGSKLVGTGAIGASAQGTSVAISGDGLTIAVGGDNDDSGIGAVWIYVYSGGLWIQQQKIVGSGAVGATSQGFSVSLSDDGNTLAFGGNLLFSGITDAIWVFTRSGVVWTQQQKLAGTGAIGNAIQGWSVSLSADGNTLAAGGISDNSNIGAVWIFIRSAGIWTQQQKLVGSGVIGVSSQGYSVSLSSNGDVLATGGIYDNGATGAVWIFTRTTGIWSEQQKIVGTGNIGISFQGYSVSLSANGNILAFGGNGDNSNVGACWIFTRSLGVWTQQQKLVGTGNVGSSVQGTSVHLNNNGDMLVIGGSGDNGNTGAIWFFGRNNSSWTQRGSKLVGTGGINAVQGTSVAISNNGDVIVEGGRNDNLNIGAFWVFELIKSTHTIQTQSVSPYIWTTPQSNPLLTSVITCDSNGNLGYTNSSGVVAINTSDGLTADTISGGVLGAFSTVGLNGWEIVDGSKILRPKENYLTTNKGLLGDSSHVIYQEHSYQQVLYNTLITQLGSKLVGSGTSINSFQGFSVEISGDSQTIAIGCSNDNAGTGCVLIFIKSGLSYIQQGPKLVGTAVAGSALGVSVSLSSDGNTLASGGQSDNGNIGACWIFTRIAGVWSQEDKLIGTGAIGPSVQGSSVSLSSDGNTVAIGGQGDNGNIGACWIFIRTVGIWSQQAKVIGSGNIGSSLQGSSVSLSSDGLVLAVGGSADNLSVGSTWIFTKSGIVWSQQAQLIGSNVLGGSAKQGVSVSLNSDGTVLAVGGDRDNSQIGATWIFTRSGVIWTEETKLIANDGSGFPQQGLSVSISDDGLTLLVGGFVDNPNGASWIFEKTGSSWYQKGSKIVGTGNIGGAFQGWRVSISNDGLTIVSSGFNDNAQQGATWVFTQSSQSSQSTHTIQTQSATPYAWITPESNPSIKSLITCDINGVLGYSQSTTMTDTLPVFPDGVVKDQVVSIVNTLGGDFIVNGFGNEGEEIIAINATNTSGSTRLHNPYTRDIIFLHKITTINKAYITIANYSNGYDRAAIVTDFFNVQTLFESARLVMGDDMSDPVSYTFMLFTPTGAVSPFTLNFFIFRVDSVTHTITSGSLIINAFLQNFVSLDTYAPQLDDAIQYDMVYPREYIIIGAYTTLPSNGGFFHVFRLSAGVLSSVSGGTIHVPFVTANPPSFGGFTTIRISEGGVNYYGIVMRATLAASGKNNLIGFLYNPLANLFFTSNSSASPATNILATAAQVQRTQLLPMWSRTNTVVEKMLYNECSASTRELYYSVIFCTTSPGPTFTVIAVGGESLYYPQVGNIINIENFTETSNIEVGPTIGNDATFAITFRTLNVFDGNSPDGFLSFSLLVVTPFHFNIVGNFVTKHFQAEINSTFSDSGKMTSSIITPLFQVTYNYVFSPGIIDFVTPSLLTSNLVALTSLIQNGIESYASIVAYSFNTTTKELTMYKHRGELPYGVAQQTATSGSVAVTIKGSHTLTVTPPPGTRQVLWAHGNGILSKNRRINFTNLGIGIAIPSYTPVPKYAILKDGLEIL